ncbi:LacI family transcriptional regulator [Prolixibacteraceae bacterium JC049]|nr:LacI family transcriptional regulator [Prolixibacteraceae bacterium JC049]
MKKASLKDIANLLNMSKTTVSFVLNGKGDQMKISKSTQEKVMEAAKRLNYQPNQLARSLSSGKTNTIGLVIPNIGDIFYAEIARAMEKKAHKQGYNIMYCSSEEDPKREAQLINMLKARQVDGLIIAPTKLDKTEILHLKKENYPFVLIDRHFPKLDTNFVITDNKVGMHKAVDFLIKKGYKKIAFICVQNYLEVIRQRFEGYKSALRDNGIRFSNKLVKEIDYFTLEQDIHEKLYDMLSSNREIEALVFATNFLCTAGLAALKKIGLNIPKDIAVATFDDRALFQLMNPGISAVAQPTQLIGEKALEVLLDEINSEDKNPQKQKITLEPNFIIRDSQ